MTPAEFTAALAALGYSQAAFGRLIDYKPNQVNSWARGRGKVPVVVAEYLRLRLKVDELNLALERLRIQASPPAS